jgi:hypothetical protein
MVESRVACCLSTGRAPSSFGTGRRRYWAHTSNTRAARMPWLLRFSSSILYFPVCSLVLQCSLVCDELTFCCFYNRSEDKKGSFPFHSKINEKQRFRCWCSGGGGVFLPSHDKLWIHDTQICKFKPFKLWRLDFFLLQMETIFFKRVVCVLSETVNGDHHNEWILSSPGRLTKSNPLCFRGVRLGRQLQTVL